MSNVPDFSKQDILYVYIEPWITGFAPCFDNGVYSLACCKGRMRRSSISRNFAAGKTIWILSLAGNSCHRSKECKELYSGHAAICLVKVKKLLSWAEYSSQYEKRRDVIYKYDSVHDCMVWLQNDDHKTAAFIESDCGSKLSGYAHIPQIVISDEFYVFKAGNKIDGLKINRNYTLSSSISIIRDYMTQYPDAYSYRANPFDE